MKVLYHVAKDANGDPVTAYLVDGNGRKWSVPAFEPTEFESDYMAERLIERNHYLGVVDVLTTKTRTGIDYDIDDANNRAGAALIIAEKQCINDYVRMQLEDRVQKNYPPLPPVGRALDCCIKYKVDLVKMGLRPVGWDPPYAMSDISAPGVKAPITAAGEEMADTLRQLQTENALLQQNMKELMLVVGQLSLNSTARNINQNRAKDAKAKADAAANPTPPPPPDPEEQTSRVG